MTPCADSRSRGWFGASSPTGTRSFHAVLTEAGVARLEQTWPVHLHSVRRHLPDRLKELDIGKLANAFERIASSHPAP